jgi:hypothetical protein
MTLRAAGSTHLRKDNAHVFGLALLYNGSGGGDGDGDGDD